MDRAIIVNGKEFPDFSDARFWERVSCCPLCSSASITEIMQACDTHYGNPGRFPIARCENCALLFMNPLPTNAYLSTAYPADSYYSYQLEELRTLRQKALKRVKRVLRLLLGYHAGETHDPTFERPGTMLDLGCGTGAFLAAMRDRSWDVRGVESNEIAAKLGRSAHAIEIYPGHIEQANYRAQMFDYVRSNHSFEHMLNPREVLREIRRIIKPDGKLFIGVPNVNGWAAKAFGKYWWYLGAPVHPFGYSPAILTRLLVEEGFIVESLRFNSTFAGLFGSLQIYLNRRNGRPGEKGWMVNNPMLMVLGHWLAKIPDILEEGDCMELVARPSSDASAHFSTTDRNENDGPQ